MSRVPYAIARIGIVVFSGLACSASAADSSTPVPDFSGTWARQAFGFEAPESGTGPIENLVHRPNGIGSNPNMLVGDYMNPVLKPDAAARVKSLGEVSRSGMAFPDPSNQCHPQPPPYIMSGQRHV